MTEHLGLPPLRGFPRHEIFSAKTNKSQAKQDDLVTPPVDRVKEELYRFKKKWSSKSFTKGGNHFLVKRMTSSFQVAF